MRGPCTAVDLPTLGHFRKAEVPLKREVAEFRVSPCAMLPVGHHVTAAHFLAGQYVDIQGFTIGKGFQGPMKRWGFKGMPATHGTTLKHRAHGSIGQCQDPGRVWKGKKMAGQMGNDKRTVQSCFVYKVDPARNLLYIRGQVVGKSGKFVKVKDALRKPPVNPPYPAWGLNGWTDLPTQVMTAHAGGACHITPPTSSPTFVTRVTLGSCLTQATWHPMTWQKGE